MCYILQIKRDSSEVYGGTTGKWDGGTNYKRATYLTQSCYHWYKVMFVQEF